MAKVNGDLPKKLAAVGCSILKVYGVRMVDAAKFIDACEKEFALNREERARLLNEITKLVFSDSQNGGK